MDKEKSSHARAPGIDSLPGFFFFNPFFVRVVLFVFSFQLLFFTLLVLPLYNFTRCCVKRISIFAYEAFVRKEYLGDSFFCNGNRSVVCLTHSLPTLLRTKWA